MTKEQTKNFYVKLVAREHANESSDIDTTYPKSKNDFSFKDFEQFNERKIADLAKAVFLNPDSPRQDLHFLA